jgi:hypothetical protein
MAGASSRGEATPENFPYMLFKSFFERLCPLRALLTSKRMPFSFDRGIIRTINAMLFGASCVGRICDLLAIPSDKVPYLSGTLETIAAISFAYQFSEPAIWQERVRSKSHTQRLFLKPITNLQSKCPQTTARRTGEDSLRSKSWPRSKEADVRSRSSNNMG